MAKKFGVNAKPGDLCDKHGVPIYPGDLLRSFHFVERRYRRRHYLYHAVTIHDGVLFMESVQGLALPHNRYCQNKLPLWAIADSDGFLDTEVIDGESVGKAILWQERTKRQRVEVPHENHQ